MNNPLKKIFESRTEIPFMEAKGKKRTKFSSPLKLVKGTKFISFLFIGTSVLIAGAVLFAANMYYNIDTNEVVLEEIYRVAGVVRATAGLIVGGTDTQNPTAGYGLEVATSTIFSSGNVLLNAANQELRFSGGHASYYVGFKATTTLSTTTVYTWPSVYGSTGQALVATEDGTLSWSTPVGMGDITAVGNIGDGDAFTAGVPGQYLWFGQNADNRGQLNVAILSGTSTTWTLPALSGTITMASGSLGTGGVLFADSGLIATSSNFNWDNTNRYLSLGSTGNAGQLRIYSSAGGGYYLGFAANSGMTATTTYTWPTNYGTDNWVLTTDGSGGLHWKSASGTGAIVTQGTPQAGQVSFFVDANTLAGDSSFTFSTSTRTLTIGNGGVGTIIANTFTGPAGATTTISSASGQNILLDPATGRIVLAENAYIVTDSGYEIGRTGTEVLREMIPIMGFDLPVQTATTSYIKISKTLENYPFASAATGTTRVHKLVFRYAASTTNQVEWRISTSTGQTYSSSTLPVPDSNNLEQGDAYIVTATIPTDADWWMDIKTAAIPDTVRVFQIFLAAYDRIQ